MRRHVDAPPETWSLGFEDPGFNEVGQTKTLDRFPGFEMPNHRAICSARDFELLPKIVWHTEDPTTNGNGVARTLLSAASSERVKVVLTGEGADELFLGYNRYRVTRWNASLGRPYWAVMPAALSRRLREAVQALPPTLGRVARRTFVGLEPGIRGLYHENFAVFPLALQRRLFRRQDLIESRDPYATQCGYYDEATGGLLDRIGRADLRSYLLELLMKQDQMSMASSIESRVPFLDDRLVEHVVAMPADVKLPGWRTKALLRAAVRDLIPPAILERPKMGFPVPLGDWLRGGFAPIVDEFVLGPRADERRYFNRSILQQMVAEHRSGRASHADALWLLVNLEIWLRIFIDGEATGDVMRAVSPVHVPANRRAAADVAQCAFSG
jgi:asparagine synthase (glutamine-hydrolysing)